MYYYITIYKQICMKQKILFPLCFIFIDSLIMQKYRNNKLTYLITCQKVDIN